VKDITHATPRPDRGRTLMDEEHGAKVWMDGTLVDYEKAQVHVLSHALHYGVGVFEGIRAYSTPGGGAIFRLQDHLRRLQVSSHVYHLPIPYSLEEMTRAVVETQAVSGVLPSYIRPIIYRGEPGLGVKNTKGKVSLAIGVIAASKYLGAESESGVRAKVSPFRKPRSDVLPSFAKATGNYLNSYIAGVDAQTDGYDEAVLLDTNGYVAEGTGENVFLVRDGALYTPGPPSEILMGVTRDSILRIARDIGLNVVERLISLNELLTADEVFFSGTYAEIAPVREIGRHVIGDGKIGPLTREIMTRFTRIIHGEDANYAEWLTPVPSPGKRTLPVARARR